MQSKFYLFTFLLFSLSNTQARLPLIQWVMVKICTRTQESQLASIITGLSGSLTVDIWIPHRTLSRPVTSVLMPCLSEKNHLLA